MEVAGAAAALAVQGSVTSAMPTEALEHIPGLFAQQQPAALSMRS